MVILQGWAAYLLAPQHIWVSDPDLNTPNEFEANVCVPGPN